MEEYFYSFSSYLKQKFGAKVRRLGLNAGFLCPNRDGTISADGCIFCNEEGFSPFAKTTMTLPEQIKKSMESAKRYYGAEKFIAYFQNATNTYAAVRELKQAYDVIKGFPDIVGLYISTRPDCVDDKRLALISSYCGAYDVCIEYGLQSSHDRTLKFINRGHSFHDFVRAAQMSSEKGIKVGAHIILGLPGETREDMLKTAEKIAKLPVFGLKFHMLHALKGTVLEEQYNKGSIRLMSFKDYVAAVCDFLELTDPQCVIFRVVSDARPDILVSPKWVNRKSAVLTAVNDEFKRRGTRQGSKFKG